jgi:hypothetical protein
MRTQKQDILFDYINKSKSSKQTIEMNLLKLYILLLILLAAFLYLFNGFEVNKTSFLYSFGIVTLEFLLVYMYLKFYLKYDSKSLFAPVPASIGKVLVKFNANNLQVFAKNKKRAINGLLIIGDKSIVFVPYKYSFMKLKSVQIPWKNITAIYKVSGLLVDNWLMKFEFYKRYIYKNTSQIVIEANGESYKFQALSTDQIVDDLNELKESL